MVTARSSTVIAVSIASAPSAMSSPAPGPTIPTPSTAHQVALDLVDEPLAFTMEPPACQLHVWSAATGVITHTSYIGQFDGPYLFANGARRGG